MVWLPTGVEFEAVAVAISGLRRTDSTRAQGSRRIIERIDCVGEGCHLCIQLR